MYWNLGFMFGIIPSGWINRNMRCIEMAGKWYLVVFGYWLIETWDVLKWLEARVYDGYNLINRNMRCIEIPSAASARFVNTWLIETWDVLKFCCVVVTPMFP